MVITVPVAKYWDEATASWRYAALDPDNPDLVPGTGGTMTGPFPLVVDAGSFSYDITVDGTLAAEKFTTTKAGVLNVGIRAGAGRTIDFGGAVVQEVGETSVITSVTTKRQVDVAAGGMQAAAIPLNTTRWGPSSTAAHLKPTVYRNNEGYVLLEGLARNLVTADPSNTEIIGTVPAGFRPPHQVIFATFNTLYTTMYARVKVFSNGDIAYHGGPQLTVGQLVGLDCCSYYTT